MPLGSNDGHNRQRFCATLLCGLVAFTQLGMPVQQARAASYNADNQLAAWGSSSLGYDANGNLTSDGTNTYSWDARNQLSSVATRRTSSSFKYDAYGRRTQKTISGASTSYLYDGANPVQELAGTTPTANLLTGFGADQYLRRTDSSGSRDFLSDGLGSTLALTDSNGAVQTSYSYEPFGNTSSSGAASTNSYQYSGRENDGSGLYYYRARYYSPGFQRFVSEDPAGFSGGSVDLYAYAGDSPVNLTDPSGEFLPLMAAGCLAGATTSALLDDVRMAIGVVKNGDPGMGAGQFASDIAIGCVTGALFGPLGKVLDLVGGASLGAEGSTALFRASSSLGGSAAISADEALAAAARAGGAYFDAASVEVRYAASESPEYFANTAGHTSFYGNGEPVLNGSGQFLIHIQDEGLVSSQEGALTVLHELMHIANPGAGEADVEAAAQTIFGGR